MSLLFAKMDLELSVKIAKIPEMSSVHDTDPIDV